MRKAAWIWTAAVAAAAGGLWAIPACAEDGNVVVDEIRTEYQRVRLVQVAEGLHHPWGMAFLPDGSMLVTERRGRLYRIAQDGRRERIRGVPEVVQAGQGGLLDIALHPRFEENGWVYLTHSSGERGATATALARGRLDGDMLVDVERIFVQDRRSRPGRHYGSRLAWTPDGKLLMTIGDRGVQPERAQDLGDHAGTVLRLNDDGTPAEGNPFADREGAQPEIYSYGHRNIQAMVVHPRSGEIWVVDHGPRGGDRLDLVRPGENYGWPVVSPGREYDTGEQWGEGRRREGMVPWVHEFLPTLAPSGLTVVTGERWPRWQGNLLVGGLASRQVRRIVIEDGEVVHEESLLHDRIGRIRDVRMGPDGNIYILTDQSDGGLYRLEPR